MFAGHRMASSRIGTAGNSKCGQAAAHLSFCAPPQHAPDAFQGRPVPIGTARGRVLVLWPTRFGPRKGVMRGGIISRWSQVAIWILATAAVSRAGITADTVVSYTPGSAPA